MTCLAGGVLTCSPTATALALTTTPDSDLFFRTAPSDSLQAIGLAQLAEQTGARTAAVAFLDDVYGRPLARGHHLRTARTPVEVDDQVPFVPATTPGAEADASSPTSASA